MQKHLQRNIFEMQWNVNFHPRTYNYLNKNPYSISWWENKTTTIFTQRSQVCTVNTVNFVIKWYPWVDKTFSQNTHFNLYCSWRGHALYGSACLCSKDNQQKNENSIQLTFMVLLMTSRCRYNCCNGLWRLLQFVDRSIYFCIFIINIFYSSITSILSIIILYHIYELHFAYLRIHHRSRR